MTTALFSHPDSLRHITPPGHPERVARIESLLPALEGLDLKRITAPLATQADLALCHPELYIKTIEAEEPDEGFAQLDGDTFMSPGSYDAACRSVGAAMQAVDMVLAGEVQNAFVATRPPGHHAEASFPMGFCLFGTIAIGAMHALERHGLSRVAVVDFDVHHGNGTQALLRGEPRALFISSHQMPLWPGSGKADETGDHDNVLNIPLAPGTGGAEFAKKYETQVFPRLEAFAPELIFISAGFDAHAADPLANLNLQDEDFAWVTDRLCEIAQRHCGGRVVSCLEGGYDLGALASAGSAHVKALIRAGI